MFSPFLPPRSFYFTFGLEGCDSTDASFQEISGLKAEWTTEEVTEGGQNSFVYRLPTRTKFSNLTLKRGVVRHGSNLAAWLSRSFSADFVSNRVEPKTAVVMLLDTFSRPHVAWTVVGAYPVSWDHSEMKSTDSGLMVETIELSCYRFFRRTFAYPDEVAAYAS